MKITREEVEHVAMLARLRLSEEEIETFTRQLDEILTYVDKLNELNTESVEPTSHPLSLGNVLRDDIVRESLDPELSLRNAPQRVGGAFKVPRVIE